MDRHFDMEVPPAPVARLTGNHAPGRLDWHGLRGRLAATYAAGAALKAAKPRYSGVFGGSFDRGSARALAAFGMCVGRGQGGVNPTALGNGNSGCDNDAAVAGAYSAGDRG